MAGIRSRLPNDSARNWLHSLNSSLDVLEALAGDRADLGVSELARRLGISKATVHAILSNFCTRGYVTRDPSTSRYRLGLRTWELGVVAINSIEITTIARPHLQELADLTGETCHLAAYSAGDALYLDLVASLNPVQAYTRIGGRAPAYCVATGKVLLAHQPESEVQRLSDLGLTRFTPLTITTVDDLLRELDDIRTNGFAVNRGEWRQEVLGVAAPILNHSNEVVAAIGLSGPSYRLNADRALALAKDVRSVAAAVSSKLGHSGAQKRPLREQRAS